MNTYSINDEKLLTMESYKEFLKQNPSRGFLNIRAYAASQAVPISGLRVVVSTKIKNDKVVFFSGETNESGVIVGIALPAPKLNLDNLNAPNKTIYDIEASRNNITKNYKVSMYENVSVVQNINLSPEVGGL